MKKYFFLMKYEIKHIGEYEMILKRNKKVMRTKYDKEFGIRMQHKQKM